MVLITIKGPAKECKELQQHAYKLFVTLGNVVRNYGATLPPDPMPPCDVAIIVQPE